MGSFNPSIFKTEFQVLIVIQPQETRLYRVKLFTPQSLSLVGPLQDEMILSKQILGVVVRRTVLNAARDTSVCGEHAYHRLNVMETEVSKNEAPKNLYHFYQSLLTV